MSPKSTTHTRQCRIKKNWPEPPLQIALLEPEIPPNTGNIARLCAATDSPLHLIGQLGFSLTNTALKRAGLDYWSSVVLKRHVSLEDFFALIPPSACYFFSTAGKISYLTPRYKPGDVLMFGNESHGLPSGLLEKYPERVVGIQLKTQNVRSLNLAAAASIALYEALRQIEENQL